MRDQLQALTLFRRVDEFDILRAIAVIGVVASHVWGLSGGFIGVDIFFVISGYVITLLLITQLESGNFSFQDFYCRRIARIIPPLLIVSIVIFLFSCIFFYTTEDSAFIRESFFFQSFFAQNFYFSARATDYFQALSTAKLNLHTWSLAVEEQFYLIYPIIFYLLYRYAKGNQIFWMLGAIFLTSFIFLINPYERYVIPLLERLLTADLSGYRLQGARYYLIFTRAWQLFLGALACLFVCRIYSQIYSQRVISTILIQSIVVICLGVIFFSFVFIEETMAWPRLIALVPAIATTCLLVFFHIYGRACLPSLFNPPLLHTLGKCSFSLYLWHWPILGMMKYTNSDFGFWWWDYIVYFALIGFLTAITYLFIEQQRYKIRPIHALIILVFFTSFSYLASHFQPNREGLPIEIQTILQTSAYSSECEKCVQIPSQPFFVLWGDSHSQMLAKVISNVAVNAGYQLVHLKGSLADDRNRLIELKASPLFFGTIVASRWSMYAVGFPKDEPQETGNRYLPLDGNHAKNRTEAGEYFREHLRRFLADLAGKPMLFILEVPRYPFLPKKELIMDFVGVKFRPLPIKTLKEHYVEQKETREIITTLIADYPNVRLADPADILCSDNLCIWRIGWKLLYMDDDHLSVYGSEKLEPLIKNFFDEFVNSR
jgi:peptidoglycan/LPS O-acetylase OafA/YrhL